MLDLNKTKERLAEYAHDAWSGWMRYMFKFGTKHADGSFTISADKVERWERQMDTHYDGLSEAEKASDRKEADEIIGIADIAALVAEVRRLQAIEAAAREYTSTRVDTVYDELVTLLAKKRKRGTGMTTIEDAFVTSARCSWRDYEISFIARERFNDDFYAKMPQHHAAYGQSAYRVYFTDGASMLLPGNEEVALLTP